MQPKAPRLLRIALTAALAALALGSGCASFSWPFSQRDGLERGFTQEELADELAAYASRFEARVSSTAEDIEEAAAERAVRKRALVWRLEMPPLLEEVAFGDPPQLAYLRCVLVAEAQRRYLASGDGRALFGALQPLAVEAAEALVTDVLAIGDRFLTRKENAEVHQRALDIAEQYPIQGRDFSVQLIPRAAAQVELLSSVSWLVALPLAPFTALQGVDSGAAALRDFDHTAQMFVAVAKALPERLRGQLELLLYDLEDRETVERGVDALDRAATSAERAATLAERLPDELRKALAESQGSVESAGRVVEQTQALAAPLAETATRLEQASAHWLAMIGPKDTGPPDPNQRPFDVRDWQAAAQSIGSAAEELRGLADDVEKVSGLTALDAAIDRLFWRALLLVVVCFALALVYRLAARRIAA